jgi:Ca2+-binding EF-hand superfamily protein
MSIRVDISRVLGYTIPEDKFEQSFRELDKDGRITKKHIIEILLLLIKREQERENEQ